MKQMQDYCTLTLAAIFMAMSCTEQAVMEESDTAGMVELNLEFSQELCSCMDSWMTNGRTSDDGKCYDLRYTVEAYLDMDGILLGNAPYKRFVFTKSDIGELGNTLRFNMEDGTYEFYVWADFVEKGTDTDYFYNTESLRKITLIGKHKGNNDFRDAFFGHRTVEIHHENGQENAVSCAVGMERALAKCEFSTTDLKAFIRSLSGNTVSGDVNPETCKVKFFYTGRMPSVFDAIFEKPCATRTGVEFESSISIDDEVDTNLGFDYVFAGEDESDVALLVGLFDEHGKLLTTTTHLSVPIKRNTVTKVDCQFITPVTL